jgi:fluoroquinolone transport system permease protein
MTALAAYRALGAIDARTVARDPLLRWLVVLTPALGLLFRFVVPAIAAALDERYGFDVAPYYPLLMSFLPVMVAAMIGSVVGFLLLDQRDERTLDALLVTPLTLRNYLGFRLAMVLAPGVVLGSLATALAGLTETSALQIAVAGLVAAPLAPIYALLLGAFAANKVQGFALAKGIGIVLVPSVAAYFVAGPWQLAFGVIPHYWPMKVFWLFDAGATGTALASAAAGLAWQGVIVALLLRQFARVVRR